MPRLKAPERREQLVDVAAKLFATHGYEGTTTAAIAEAAGVTEPILYRHFEGKQQMFIAIVRAMSEKTMRRWKEIVDDIEDPVEKIRTIAREFPEQVDHLADAYRVLHGALAVSRDPEVLAVVKKHYQEKQAFFADIIRKGQQSGHIKKNLDPNLPAWEIINLDIGFVMLSLTLPDLYGKLQHAQMVDFILSCFHE